MKAVIQAGGKGTRLAAVTRDEIPKPMVPIDGKPLLVWQIENLKKNGIREIVLLIGHLGHVIKDYFRDGSHLGVRITYLEEEEPLGTGGGLYGLRGLVGGEDFFLVYGDVFFDIDIERMLSFHRASKANATLLVHPNSHPFDSDLVVMEEDRRVTGFDSKYNVRDYWYGNCVNAGLFMLSPRIFAHIPGPGRRALEKDILAAMAAAGDGVYGYRSPEYVKDAGTVSRLEEIEKEIRLGKPERRNLKNRQKCIFLDRDGTLNIFRGLISREEAFTLEETAAEAVRKINASDYLAIVVTNQPAVARGLCGIEDIARIHRKMETLLGNEGVFLDAVEFCPHHPDKGYPEENPAYKTECRCRKPGTGMLDKYIDEYHIDRKSSWMIGDSTVDIQTGINAGVHTALVQTGAAGRDGKFQAKPELVCRDVLEAVRQIMEGDEKNGL